MLMSKYRIVTGKTKYMHIYKKVCHDFVAESVWPHYNFEKISSWIERSIDTDDGFDRVILDENNKVAGCMSVILVDDPFSDLKTTFDVVTMLVKDYRRDIGAIKAFYSMLNEFDNWCETKNVGFQRLGNAAGVVGDDVMSRILSKVNMKPMGGMYGKFRA